ncbi:hypothetical protein [Gaetbulibacter saemankumensis]|uniref:hypothetical protein n=1 Tax=Gaetbulibacter saemankumensis TaxID=311208 RepID=UPI000403C911|nr:hypothetical protein [Gaetbulibacter saemankumensis]
MRLFITYIIIFIIGFSAQAQIDTRNKSIAIPAVESKKDSLDLSSITPSQPIENNQAQFGSLNVPELQGGINTPKKQFSLFGEEFGNPGELYAKRIDKNLESARLITPEEIEQRNGSKTNQYLGDFKTKSEFVNIVYRDHGAIDGDVIQVLVNDDVVQARVFLTGGFKGYKLQLHKGFNKIDFLALNQGQSGPNTAEFKVIDDSGSIISHNQWNLATGVKATIIVVKE